MLKQINAPDHVIALFLDGTLTGEGLQEYRHVLEKSYKSMIKLVSILISQS